MLPITKALCVACGAPPAAAAASHRLLPAACCLPHCLGTSRSPPHTAWLCSAPLLFCSTSSRSLRRRLRLRRRHRAQDGLLHPHGLLPVHHSNLWDVHHCLHSQPAGHQPGSTGAGRRRHLLGVRRGGRLQGAPGGGWGADALSAAAVRRASCSWTVPHGDTCGTAWCLATRYHPPLLRASMTSPSSRDSCNSRRRWQEVGACGCGARGGLPAVHPCPALPAGSSRAQRHTRRPRQGRAQAAAAVAGAREAAALCACMKAWRGSMAPYLPCLAPSCPAAHPLLLSHQHAGPSAR